VPKPENMYETGHALICYLKEVLLMT